MSARLQPVSIPPCLLVATPTVCLQSSTPPRRYTYSTPPELLRQRGNACSAPPEANTSTPPRHQARSMPPELHLYSPLRRKMLREPARTNRIKISISVQTPSTRANPIEIFINPSRFSCNTNRNSLFSCFIAYYYTVWPRPRVWSGHLQHFSTSGTTSVASSYFPPFLHVATPVASLQSSRPSYLHIPTHVACLQISRPPGTTP